MFSYLYNIDIKSIPVLPTSPQHAVFDTDYTDLKKSESTNILAVTRFDLQRATHQSICFLMPHSDSKLNLSLTCIRSKIHRCTLTPGLSMLDWKLLVHPAICHWTWLAGQSCLSLDFNQQGGYFFGRQPRRSATQFNFRLECVDFTSGFIVALFWARAYCFASSFAGPCVLNSVHCQHVWPCAASGVPWRYCLPQLLLPREC